MELKFHNTLTGKKETFSPIDDNRVTAYVCGPTVYDYVHIGNGRPAVAFDVLYRLLKASYDEVVYARNVTDIDDKINNAALKNKESIAELADRFTIEYNLDISALNVLPVTIEPRATHDIDEIIALIKTLIEKNNAYPADGHVLFSVPSDPAYGSLSNRSMEDMLDGARVEIAPYKKDPKDFVLWKPSTRELPGWDSPWGRGRPGWHIECSAMIRKHLGEHIDIHGGGNDLTFPHHENEMAQSCCASDDGKFVNYWLHNGMLTLDDEKMSKSLGNIVTIHDLRAKYDGEVLRYALLSGQYRSPLAWNIDLIDQAQASLDRWYQALLDAAFTNNPTSVHWQGAKINEFPEVVVEPLSDDLNTPRAFAAMHKIASKLNLSTQEEEKRALADQLLAGGWLLGLLQKTPIEYFQDDTGLDNDAIDTLIQQRNQARDDNNYSRADEIRDELLGLGIELEDTREGTRWKRIK